MTQDGTQSRHGSEGLWCVSLIIAILYCRTTGCTMFTGGFKAYPIYPASQLPSNAAEDGLLDDLSHSAVLGAAGRQNSRLKSGIVIVGPSPTMWAVTNESKTIKLRIFRHYSQDLVVTIQRLLSSCTLRS